MHSYELRRGELFQDSTHAPASAELRRAVLIFINILTFTIEITKLMGSIQKIKKLSPKDLIYWF